jgi:PAS domain S-box-containing protein
MGSATLADALEQLQPFVYGGLFLAALIQWRRRPGRSSLWLVATFGVLAAVVLAGLILPEDSSDPAMEWAGRGLIAVLVLFPYFLYRFTTTLLRPIPWVTVTGTVLTASVAIVVFLLPAFPEEDAPQPRWVGIFIIALLTQWVFLSGAVAIRLWRAGKGQPTVARRRMRTMALGATGLALALVVAGQFATGEGITDVFFELLVLGAAPLMLIGFAPPRTLRMLWRRREEAELREAAHSLMEATTTQEVARILLPHARTLLGAHAATLEDEDGAIEASVDANGDELARTDPTSDRRREEEIEGSVIPVLLRKGRLVVHTSPLTPFFGDEELSELRELASLADLAIARNELLDSQRTLAAIVESSDDAIISRTLDGTITSWNRGAEKIFGYQAHDAVGGSISMLDPLGYDDVPEIVEKILRGESTDHFETQRRTKSGKTIDVALTISPIKDAVGAVTGASVIARDVSDRRQLDLERSAAYEAADRANRAKSEFLSRMSHELRTPLNSVLGFAQLLEMEPLAPRQEESTREILKAGSHLLELIDEVLDIARIEAGRLRLSLEPVDAVLVIDECISLLGPQAHQEGVTVAMDGTHIGSMYVVADRQRLKQVLLNLLSNGIKYNREQGTVQVSIERTAEGSRIRIDVSDSGRGIPPERIEQLFAPFERLGLEGSGIQGTGLGLALTKPLVEAMGGTISVTSEPGKGSTFSVELASAAEAPLSPDPHPDGLPDLVGSTAAGSRTVLYVEDNLANLKLMERIMERRPNITLLSAMQGSLGVTLARDHLPDLIFLDLNLPDMGGVEMLGRLHADPRTADLPVVVISADVTEGQHARLLEAGARDFVPKPFDVERLLGIVDEFCGGALDEDRDGHPPNGHAPRGVAEGPSIRTTVPHAEPSTTTQPTPSSS